MPAQSLTQPTEQRFIDRVAQAVSNNDLVAVRREVVIYSEMLGTERVKELLGEGVVLALDVDLIPRYLEMVADGEDLNDIIQDLLADMVKTLTEEGLEVGKDFSYGEDPETGSPHLKMSPDAYLKASTIYVGAAWKQCLPFIKSVG